MPLLDSALARWDLAASFALAVLTLRVAFDVVARVRSHDRRVATSWQVNGSVVLGSGLWGTHFGALHAVSVGHDPLGAATAVAWALSVAAAATWLWIVRRDYHDAAGRLLAHGAATLAIALALTATTLVETAETASPWTASPWLMLASALATAMLVAVSIELASPRLDGADPTGAWTATRRLIVALVAGTAYAAIHAITIAATSPAGTVPPRADAASLVVLVCLAVAVLLMTTWCGAHAFGRVDLRHMQLAGSLESAEARLLSVHDELRQRAFVDPPTGLPNRLLFEDRLAHALDRMARTRRAARGAPGTLTILFIDIDGFLPINQSLGHAVGDEVLREVALRVRGQTRASDTVARFAADQFLVLVDAPGPAGDGVALASRILAAMAAPIELADRTVPVSVSIGIVVHPDQGERDKLVANAESAMQAAKRAGRGTYALFASHMQDDAAEQLALINDLRQAIDLGQLALHYQPKIDGRRNVICGVEALLRWTHPVRGVVSPALFIPIAERFGFINALGSWVIDEACRQIEAWTRSGVRMRVAINLSVHQLREAGLVERIETALARHGVAASQLLCEITESVAMQDVDATQRTLDDLRRIGVWLAIDDFGTGYSSLSTLRQLPARQLKIDRSFVNDLEKSDARAVVDAVVRLGHALGLRVVAEGVETAAQRDVLLDLGCDELQGYFFAKPMTADKLVEWTRGKKPAGTLDFARSLVLDALGA